MKNMPAESHLMIEDFSIAVRYTAHYKSYRYFFDRIDTAATGGKYFLISSYD